MSHVDIKLHKQIVNKLQKLLEVSNNMSKKATDSLLINFIEECSSWLKFAESHTDTEELSTLEREICTRFYERYNVRIEPENLDNIRLTLTEELIEDFESL